MDWRTDRLLAGGSVNLRTGMPGRAPPTSVRAASPHLGQTKSKGGLLFVPFHLVHDDGNEDSTVAVHVHRHVVKALALPDEITSGVALDVPLPVQDFAGMRSPLQRGMVDLTKCLLVAVRKSPSPRFCGQQHLVFIL